MRYQEKPLSPLKRKVSKEQHPKLNLTSKKQIHSLNPNVSSAARWMWGCSFLWAQPFFKNVNGSSTGIPEMREKVKHQENLLGLQTQNSRKPVRSAMVDSKCGTFSPLTSITCQGGTRPVGVHAL